MEQISQLTDLLTQLPPPLQSRAFELLGAVEDELFELIKAANVVDVAVGD